MSARIDIPDDKIAEFCRQNGIQCLSLFGSVLRDSVLRDDFTPESDIDVLVEFKRDEPRDWRSSVQYPTTCQKFWDGGWISTQHSV